jgi:hypothetical protein
MQHPTAPSARPRRRSAAALLLAAFAVLAPGAAIAAPTVIDVAHSAPVSLLHGDTTPPRPASRPTGQLAADDLTRRRNLTTTGGLRVRRRIRRALRARSSATTIRWIVDDKVRTALTTVLRRRGPPAAQLPIDGPWRADPTPRTCSARAARLHRTPHVASRSWADDGAGGARSGQLAVTPAGVHTTLRRGAGSARGATRHPGSRTTTGRVPVPCTSQEET